MCKMPLCILHKNFLKIFYCIKCTKIAGNVENFCAFSSGRWHSCQDPFPQPSHMAQFSRTSFTQNQFCAKIPKFKSARRRARLGNRRTNPILSYAHPDRNLNQLYPEALDLIKNICYNIGGGVRHSTQLYLIFKKFYVII